MEFFSHHRRQGKHKNHASSSGESDIETKDAEKLNDVPEVPIEKEPLSKPPSPFLSQEIYLQCHQEYVEEVRLIVINILFNHHLFDINPFNF